MYAINISFYRFDYQQVAVGISGHDSVRQRSTAHTTTSLGAQSSNGQ